MSIRLWIKRLADWSESRRTAPRFIPVEIVEMAEDGVLHFSLSGRRLYVNPRASVFLKGVKSENFDSFVNFLRTEGKHYAQTRTNEDAIESLSCLIELQGRGLRVRARRIHDGEIAFIMTDITDALVAQSRIMQAGMERRELELALEAAAGGVAVCCRHEGKATIRFANRLFRVMTGMPKNDVAGIDLATLLQGSVGADAGQLRSAMEEQKNISIEWRFDRVNAAPQWYEVSLRILGDGDESMPGCYACFLNDVTDVHVQKAQLFQSQKLEALGQLAGGVAHDFNNLLSIVDGYTRMALKHIDQGSPAFSYLERIKQANRRGASLTKQLMTFGRHKIVTESVSDIGAILEEQETLLTPLLNASIGLSVTAQDNLFVDCPPDGISQILMNLVINARDAMPDGGSIIISAECIEWTDMPLNVSIGKRSDKYVCLSVEDAGVGMDHEMQARIFDPFFTTKEQGKGTGLGLSMVYGIMKQAGGAIDVWSRPEEGTAMRLYFPLSERKAEKKFVIRRDAGNSALRFEGYTALLAEDEPDLLYVVGSMLEDMGIKVIKAADGNDALLKQDDYEGDIDFLLTDVVMPELDGVRLSEMIEEIRPETKILFMSGYPANGAMARVSLPEKAWLLAKPVEFDRLAGVLEACLQEDKRGVLGDSARGMYRWQPAKTV